jgi:hypothetical protein
VQTQRTRLGLYRVTDATASGTAVLLAAHTALATTAGTGFLFITNPTASTVAMSVKAIQLSISANAATAALTTPRVAINRFQFTGTITYTPAGGIGPALRVRAAGFGLAADAAAVGRVGTAITGQTTTASSVFPVRSWLVPAILTAVGTYGVTYMWDPDVEDDEIILGPGEGLAIQQMDAGTTSDPRRIAISATWEEFTAP